MKLVSVVVATYKRDDDLKNALDSLAVQSYTDVEIVLVDDNGNAEWTKKVNAIVEAFRKKQKAVAFCFQATYPFIFNDT